MKLKTGVSIQDEYMRQVPKLLFAEYRQLYVYDDAKKKKKETCVRFFSSKQKVQQNIKQND